MLLAKPGALFLIAFELFQVIGRIFFGRQNCVEYGSEENHRAEVEREPHGVRNCGSRSTGVADGEPMREDVRHGRSENGAEPDEKTLHDEAAGALRFRKQVGDEGAKRFHADVDGGVKNPEKACGHPERGTAGHQNQRGGAKNRACEEIRTTAAEASPGAIAGVADDRLHEKSGDRRGQPEVRELIGTGAEVLIDGAHVGHLKSPAELNAEEAKAHVEQLDEVSLRFFLIHGIAPACAN